MNSGEVNNSGSENNFDAPSPQPTPPPVELPPETPPELPTNDPAEKSTKNPKNKLKIILLISAILLITASIIIVSLVMFNKPPEIEIDPRNFAEIYNSSNSPDEAIQIFQNKIDATEDKEEKAKLLIERGTILYRIATTPDFYTDTIFNDLTEAFELRPTSGLAFRLYNYYQSYDMNEQANYYFNKYLEIEGYNDETL